MLRSSAKRTMSAMLRGGLGSSARPNATSGYMASSRPMPIGQMPSTGAVPTRKWISAPTL